MLAVKAAAGWQPDCYDGDEAEFEDEDGEEVEGEEEEEEDVVYWPHVPGEVAVSRMSSIPEVRQTVLPCFMSVESAEVSTEDVRVNDEGGKDPPRWPSAVKSEYGARMEEMWRKCGEKLGREVRGGRWWM